MAYVVNIHEAETQFSRLIERAARGERIVIARAGKPVADLVPHRGGPVVSGDLEGQGRLAYDDAGFEVHPDIQQIFYGDADARA